MTALSGVVGAAVVATIAATTGVVQTPPAPVLTDVLRQSASYVGTYATKLSGVTLEEQYLLIDVSSRIMVAPQRIASDVVFIRLNVEGHVVGVRDPFTIDNRKLRDRQPRIVATLAEPTLTNWEIVQGYSREHAVAFLANVVVWFSDPVLALQFMTASNQPRITYKFEGARKMNGVQVQGVGFKENTSPGRTYLLGTPGNPIGSGRLWIDPATGAIHMTELWIQSEADTARIQVSYVPDAKLGILLPRDATCSFENREAGSGSVIGPLSRKLTLEATAKYSNPRYTPLDLARIPR